MKQLLGNTSLRLDNIVLQLRHSSHWLSTKAIAKAIGSPDRTVVEDLKNIRTRWGDLFQFDFNPNQGFKIKNKNTATYAVFLRSLIQEAIPIHALLLLLFEPNQHSEYYELKLYISTSTFKRTVRMYNQILSPYGTKIVSKNGHYQLTTTNESYFRKFFSCLLLEVYGTELNLSSFKIDAKLITQFLEINFPKNKFTYDQMVSAFVFAFFTVSLYRENQGCNASSHLETITINSDQNQLILNQITPIFPNITMASLQRITTEVSSHLGIEKAINSKPEIIMAANEFAEGFAKSFNVSKSEIDLDTLKLLLMSLYNSYDLYPFKTSLIFDRIALFAESFCQANPFFTSIIEPLIAKFCQQTAANYQLLYNDLIYWLSINYPDLTTSWYLTRNVLLLTDFSREQGWLVSNYIYALLENSNHLNLKIDVHLFHDFDVSTISPLNYDLVVTTVPNLNLSVKTVLIDDYPNNDNMRDIYRAVYY